MSIDRFLEKENFILVCHSNVKYCCVMINLKKKILYSVFNENSIKSNTVIKWISKSNFNFDIHEVFKICFEVTDNTSVQWVQFRILHRFLLVIYFLKKKQH